MLAAEDRYEREFHTALGLYGEEMAFERARTLLAGACGGAAHGGAAMPGRRSTRRWPTHYARCSGSVQAVAS